MSTPLPQRKDIPDKYKWNLASIYATDELWEAAVEELKENLRQAEGFKGRLAVGPEVLADYLALSETITQAISKIYVYGGLPANTDTNNQDALARQDQVRGLIGRVMAALSFAEPEMIAIGFLDTLNRWLAADPSLGSLRSPI